MSHLSLEFNRFHVIKLRTSANRPLKFLRRIPTRRSRHLIKVVTAMFKFRFSRKYSGSTGILPHQSPTRCPFPATQPREMRAVVVADAVAAVDDGDGVDVAVVVAFELLRGMQVAAAVVVAFELPQAMPQLAAAAVVAGDVVVVASEQPPKKQQLVVAADAVAAAVASVPPPSLLPSR